MQFPYWPVKIVKKRELAMCKEIRAGKKKKKKENRKRKVRQVMYSPALSCSCNYPWGRKVTWHVLFLQDKQRRIAGICSYRRNRWTPAVLSKKGLTLNPRDIPSNYAIKKMRGRDYFG